MNEDVIIENGIRVYRDYICHCKDKDGNNCGLRIPYPTYEQKRRTYKCYGIPKYIRGHNSRGKGNSMFGKYGEDNPLFGRVRPKDVMEKLRIANIGRPVSQERRNKQSKVMKEYYEEHPELREQISKAKKRYIKEHPDKIEILNKKQSKYMKEYCKKHPEYMKNLRKINAAVSKSELIMKTELDNLKIMYIPNAQEIIGTPDAVIPTKDEHPVALFEDGCYNHGCLQCYPIDKITHNEFLRHSERRHYDKKINKKLTKLGFIVIRIWEHDIKNGKYKNILKNLKESIIL